MRIFFFKKEKNWIKFPFTIANASTAISSKAEIESRRGGDSLGGGGVILKVLSSKLDKIFLVMFVFFKKKKY